MKIFCRLICIIAVFAFQSAYAQAPDPKMVVGPEKCGECHKAEFKTWKKTHHYKTFKKMHRTKEAKSIKEKMGIRRIKAESDCLNCHYTSKPKGSRIKPIAGISCESCHTPAKKWLDVHNDLGGKDVKPKDEKPEHRKMRIAKMKELGMITHDNIYALASNCFSCHTVPNQKLVDVGGHKAGSKFELVSWSQGEVRHNFISSADGKTNVEDPQPRKRMLYVVGRAVDLEYGLRGMAIATEAGKYADKMAARVKAAIGELEKINKASAIPEISKMISEAKAAKLAPNNKDALLKVATEVSMQAKKFTSTHDGNKIAAIDKLIPTKYKN